MAEGRGGRSWRNEEKVKGIFLSSWRTNCCSFSVSLSSNAKGAPFTYSVTAPGSITVTSAATTGGNNDNLLGWTTPTEADSVGCATFVTGSGDDQQGIALRIYPRIISGGKTGLVGLTVTRNILYGEGNPFNFHVWNTTSSTPFVQSGQVVLPVLPYLASYPLNMCAQTITSEDFSSICCVVAWYAPARLGRSRMGRARKYPCRCISRRTGWNLPNTRPNPLR